MKRKSTSEITLSQFIKENIPNRIEKKWHFPEIEWEKWNNQFSQTYTIVDWPEIVTFYIDLSTYTWPYKTFSQNGSNGSKELQIILQHLMDTSREQALEILFQVKKIQNKIGIDRNNILIQIKHHIALNLPYIQDYGFR